MNRETSRICSLCVYRSGSIYDRNRGHEGVRKGELGDVIDDFVSGLINHKISVLLVRCVSTTYLQLIDECNDVQEEESTGGHCQ